MAGMHMGGMPNQGMMNLNQMQQQQLMQQQQQASNTQQMLQAQGVQSQPIPNPQMGAGQIANPQMANAQIVNPQVANPGMTNQAVPAQAAAVAAAGAAGTNPPADQQQKPDHISKVKNLIWPLKESLATSIKAAAQNFYQNGMIDFGTLKGTDNPVPKFDKQLEEFYSICDQMELNLQAAIACATQVSSSQRHIPAQVSMARQEPHINHEFISYPSYVGIAKNQVSYVKDIVEALNDTAQNLSGD